MNLLTITQKKIEYGHFCGDCSKIFMPPPNYISEVTLMCSKILSKVGSCTCLKVPDADVQQMCSKFGK